MGDEASLDLSIEKGQLKNGSIAGYDCSRVTVVVPTYNRRERVRACLRGLFRCLHEPESYCRHVDLHVVDDGSSDGTQAALEDLHLEAPRCVSMVIHLQKHQGAGAARNRAIQLATTDLVVFLDDDCVPEPGWLSALVDGPWPAEVGARGGRIISPTGGNRIERYCRHIRYNEFPPDDGPIRFLNTANCAYPRRVLLELDGLDTRLYGGGEAQDLSHRILTAGFELDYAAEAVVVHYHRQSIRALLHGAYRRGARSTLRRVLWGVQAVPNRKRLRKEVRELSHGLLPVGLRAQAAVLRTEKGVAPEDSLAFAALTWAQQLCWGLGKVAMMSRIARGKESLEGMEARAPEGSSNPLIRRHSLLRGDGMPTSQGSTPQGRASEAREQERDAAAR